MLTLQSYNIGLLCCFSASKLGWPRVAPGSSSFCTVQDLRAQTAGWEQPSSRAQLPVCSPTLTQAEPPSAHTWPSTLEGTGGLWSDASPDAARCQMPRQSSPCSCWLSQLLLLPIPKPAQLHPTPFLEQLLQFQSRQKLCVTHSQTLGTEVQHMHDSNRQNRLTTSSRAGTDYKKALENCISKRFRDKINTVNIIQPFIARERPREEEQYSLCCFDWHHCLSRSDRLPG